MTYLLDLPPELEARLLSLAAQRGADATATALQVLAAGLHAVPVEAATAPAIGSLEDAAAHLARVRALLAAPIEVREAAIAADADALQAFYDSPEGRAEWEEMQPWLNTPGPDIDALEASDAAESVPLMAAQERAA